MSLSSKGKPPFKPSSREEVAGRLYARYGQTPKPITAKPKKKKRKKYPPVSSPNKEDKWYCPHCRKFISENKRRRHIKKRCGVKPFRMRGMRPMLVTPEMIKQIRSGQFE